MSGYMFNIIFAKWNKCSFEGDFQFEDWRRVLDRQNDLDWQSTVNLLVERTELGPKIQLLHCAGMASARRNL